MYYPSQFSARKYSWFPGMTHEFGIHLLHKKWSFAIKDFFIFCSATSFTSEVFLIKKIIRPWFIRLVCMFVNRFTIQLSKMVQFCPFLLKAVKTSLSKFIIPIISERFHHAMLQGFESLPFRSPNFTIFVYWLNTWLWYLESQYKMNLFSNPY